MQQLVLVLLTFTLGVLCLVAGLDFPTEQDNTNFWTTNYGAPVPDNDHSLSAGVDGPTLLEDYVLIEKLANFARERIPERIVHASGASAKGYFRVTGDVSQYTFADFLQPNKITPTIVRFSTVVPARGAPQTARDPRGFATKFYTQQGNYDLVGINFPVFFIRDGIKFPDMVHSFKPNPVNNQIEWWRAWDFFSSHPESLLTFTYLFDDVGVPTDFRHMDGAGVHTYRWISASGKEKFVKYWWFTQQGVASLETDEQVKNITNADYATLDLFTSIEAGEFPSWILKVQVLDPADVDQFDFDILDPTKVWPFDKVPLIEVGIMTLNETVSNYFTETEQLAFAPSNIVPGIFYSEDKLLQARLFSYPDAQRYRLGGNYLLLPVNAPRCPFMNHHYDGVMNIVKRSSEINYFPSKINGVTNAKPYPTDTAPIYGTPTRGVVPKTDDFTQAGQLFRSYDPARQQRFIGRLVGTLQDPKLPDGIREIIIGYWNQVDCNTLGPALRRAFPN
eukprot:Phypoly_transcript_08055.p1 GENE.Phypoly_transcript_08055~~Phypoly_transcript_08055.p1  ORF type:complete len:505 (-),score=95.63 Phypoly_transcript_08055:45-1559(-)